jgi:heme iron utilization protein
MTTTDTSTNVATNNSAQGAGFDPHRSGRFDPQPGVQCPSHAERCRTLVESASKAVLSTHAREPFGYPFGSLASIVVDAEGTPWTLISSMAEHTRNLCEDPRASMLIAEEPVAGADPLALARLSLIGVLTCVEPVEHVRQQFLERNPGAVSYVDFPDFSFWRLDAIALRYVGGFGRMSWVDPTEYRASAPDPLARSAAAIVDHMNADHSEASVSLLRHFLDRDVISATLTSVDRLGCDFDTVSASGSLPLRLAFPSPATTTEEVRASFISMLNIVREHTNVTNK